MLHCCFTCIIICCRHFYLSTNSMLQSLSIEIHFLKNILLSIRKFILTFFVNMAFKMIFMVGLPWPWTQKTETFSTYTSHKITSSTSFNCFFTPWAKFRMNRHPFSISFLFQYVWKPSLFLLTCARTMIVRLAFEAKRLPTSASNSLQIQVIDLDAVVAIGACTKLIVSVDWREQFTQDLFVSI